MALGIAASLKYEAKFCCPKLKVPSLAKIFFSEERTGSDTALLELATLLELIKLLELDRLLELVSLDIAWLLLARLEEASAIALENSDKFEDELEKELKATEELETRETLELLIVTELIASSEALEIAVDKLELCLIELWLLELFELWLFVLVPPTQPVRAAKDNSHKLGLYIKHSR